MTTTVTSSPRTLPVHLHLTWGWPKIERDHWSEEFRKIEHQQLTRERKSKQYQTLLHSTLAPHEQTYNFKEVDALFRKTTIGFQPIKHFFSNLLTLNAETLNVKSVHCYIDAFAYSFLKGAKNFDLFLPYDSQQNLEFERTYQSWMAEIKQLEEFERFGIPIEQTQKENYLKFRKILVRKSARDELRALSCLLLNGPSSIEMVSTDLGLNYSLSQRTISVFEPASIVEHRGHDVYAIATSALPLVIFGLREVLGLDLLSSIFETE